MDCYILLVMIIGIKKEDRIVEKKLSGEERKSLTRIAHFLFSFFAREFLFDNKYM